MTEVLILEDLDETGLGRLAELIALKARAGDCIALEGDLGAGKTTFARSLIRALLGDATSEVPSPTFPIVQPYDTPRLAISHFDLYRLAGPDDLDEVGFHDALGQGLVIVEWPDRAAGALPADRIDISLAAGTSDNRRTVTCTGHASSALRLERLHRIRSFLGTAGRIAYMQGDASARTYARIETGEGSLVLMDSPAMTDGPPVHNGLPYSRVAHLAEDVRPFVALNGALQAAGLSVPAIHRADLAEGLLLLEDLGDQTFGRALASGASQAELWAGAVDVLLHLRRHPLPLDLPLPDGTLYRLPRFDRAALEIELGLILDWYWPEMHGHHVPGDVRQAFIGLWSPVLDRLLAEPPGLFLRDFHSPNLFWLPDRAGVRRVGVIDFQDALAEPWALDLVSLLQDARVDVPAPLERMQRDRYVATVAAREPDFDAAAFLATYAAFGAQRNTRLLGLWIRLLRRDGKAGYLAHLPRTWDYLMRNLAHPDLAHLRSWYDAHFPEALRHRTIVP